MLDLKLLFRDLTQLGLPKSQFSLVNDETSYNYNPDRYNFYVNLLDNVADPDQKIASKVFGILARNRRQHEKIQEKVEHIAAAIRYLKSTYTRDEQGGGDLGELNTLQKDLNNTILGFPVMNDEYEFTEEFTHQKPEEKQIAPQPTTPEPTSPEPATAAASPASVSSSSVPVAQINTMASNRLGLLQNQLASQAKSTNAFQAQENAAARPPLATALEPQDQRMGADERDRQDVVEEEEDKKDDNDEDRARDVLTLDNRDDNSDHDMLVLDNQYSTLSKAHDVKSLLWHAIQDNQTENVKALLAEQHINVDEPYNNTGKTPLEYAIDQNNDELINILIEYSTNIQHFPKYWNRAVLYKILNIIEYIHSSELNNLNPNIGQRILTAYYTGSTTFKIQDNNNITITDEMVNYFIDKINNLINIIVNNNDSYSLTYELKTDTGEQTIKIDWNNKNIDISYKSALLHGVLIGLLFKIKEQTELMDKFTKLADYINEINSILLTKDAITKNINIINIIKEYNDFTTFIKRIHDNTVLQNYFNKGDKLAQFSYLSLNSTLYPPNAAAQVEISNNGNHQGENTELHEAVINNDENKVKNLITNNYRISDQNREGKTPLHLAIENGNLPIFNLLMSKGPDIDLEDTNGMTPLKLSQKIINNIDNNDDDKKRVYSEIMSNLQDMENIRKQNLDENKRLDNSFPSYDYLRKTLQYPVKQVAGDGWCFFYAVNGALGKAYSKHNSAKEAEKEAKNLIKSIIKTQKEKKMNQYEGLNNKDIWPGEDEFKAAAISIDKCIYIYLTYSYNGSKIIHQNPLLFTPNDKKGVCIPTNNIYLNLDTGIDTGIDINKPNPDKSNPDKPNPITDQMDGSKVFSILDKNKSVQNKPIGVHFSFLEQTIDDPLYIILNLIEYIAINRSIKIDNISIGDTTTGKLKCNTGQPIYNAIISNIKERVENVFYIENNTKNNTKYKAFITCEVVNKIIRHFINKINNFAKIINRNKIEKNTIFTFDEIKNQSDNLTISWNSEIAETDRITYLHGVLLCLLLEIQKDDNLLNTFINTKTKSNTDKILIKTDVLNKQKIYILDQKRELKDIDIDIYKLINIVNIDINKSLNIDEYYTNLINNEPLLFNLNTTISGLNFRSLLTRGDDLYNKINVTDKKLNSNNTSLSQKKTPAAKEAWGEGGGMEPLDIIRQIGGSYFSERLNELNKIRERKDLKKKQREEAEDIVAIEYKNNPLYSPELEQATYTDRIVFIAVTFVFRAISLLLVQSAINTQFIDTFVKAFTYYFLIYSILFTIWILIVNMRKDNHIMGLLFYYVNANYDASIWFNRIMVHLLLQLLILPIPILLTPKFKNKSETDSFEKRERLYNTLTFFTFIIWIITSLIALRA